MLETKEKYTIKCDGCGKKAPVAEKHTGSLGWLFLKDGKFFQNQYYALCPVCWKTCQTAADSVRSAIKLTCGNSELKTCIHKYITQMIYDER